MEWVGILIMKKFNKWEFPKTQIVVEALEEGESIEEMLTRATENNEPLEATAPMIYTEDAAGVQPEFDIRTDRFDLALEATDKFSKSERAKRESKPDKEQQDNSADTPTELKIGE